MPRKPKVEIRGVEKGLEILWAREGRLGLPYLPKPLFFRIGPNQYLGYGGNRRHPGNWYAKVILGVTADGKQDRRQICFGPADDLPPTPEGEPAGVSYSEAVQRAGDWFVRVEKGEPLPWEVVSPSVLYPTLADALDAYFEHLNIPKERSRKTAFSRIRKTKGEIGHLVIANLTRMDLENWLAMIVRTPPRIRSGKGENQASKAGWNPEDPDAIRARKGTANRGFADVKAALNYTFGKNGATSSLEWDVVKPFKGVDKARGEALSPAQVVQFLNLCKPEFRPLAYGALLLGARYGELTSLRVSSFRVRQRHMVFEAMHTKTKKTRFVPITDEGMAILMAICRDRGPDEPLFLRANGGSWGPSTQYRPMLDSTKAMDIDACFYSLRHTCITRLLEDGIPMSTVAEIMGTSEAEIEKHYKHISPATVSHYVNARSRTLALSAERIEQTRLELEAQYAAEEVEIPPLAFTPEDLHPTTYLGKIKGGSEDAPLKLRPTREELEALVAQELPATHIAKLFCVSDVLVAKWCRTWGIQKPGRGYFSKKRGEAIQAEKREERAKAKKAKAKQARDKRAEAAQPRRGRPFPRRKAS